MKNLIIYCFGFYLVLWFFDSFVMYYGSKPLDNAFYFIYKSFQLTLLLVTLHGLKEYFK